MKRKENADKKCIDMKMGGELNEEKKCDNRNVNL